MKWCSLCVMPSTRPGLTFDDDGVCDACRTAAARESIDWQARERDWQELCAWARDEAAYRGNAYDCIVPVSGGKDSHFQVLKCLDSGLTPLCVSFEPTVPTEVGKRNLANLSRFADVVQFRKNRTVYAELCRIGLEVVGDNEWPNHVGIFTVPVREAVARRIPLVVWGENSQAEYGGPDADSRSAMLLDERWLSEFGGLRGLRPADLVEDDDFPNLTVRTLTPYLYPENTHDVRGVFLGQYFKWDARAQVEIVERRMGGFERSRVPGTYIDYENLDDFAAVAVHDWLGYLKYGYSRVNCHASIDIRNGRATRELGVKLVRTFGGVEPTHEIRDLAGTIGVTSDDVRRVARKFTNLDIFERDGAKLVERFPCAE